MLNAVDATAIIALLILRNIVNQTYSSTAHSGLTSLFEAFPTLCVANSLLEGKFPSNIPTGVIM
jgi:hypothetical protein